MKYNAYVHHYKIKPTFRGYVNSYLYTWGLEKYQW